MKRLNINFFFVLFFVFLHTSCASSNHLSDQPDSDQLEKTVASKKQDSIFLIEWKDQYYYVEGKKELRKTLKSFSKFPLFITSSLYFLGSFETDVYYETDIIYKVIDKNVRTYRSPYLYIGIDRTKHTYRDSLHIVHPLPKEEKIDEAFSKLKKPVVKEFQSKNHKEVRELIVRLLEDENVICIFNINKFTKEEVYYSIYVPASSREEIRTYDIQKEIGFSDQSVINAAPDLKYNEETHEAELHARGTIEDYNKITQYRKSEYKETTWEMKLKYFEKQ